MLLGSECTRLGRDFPLLITNCYNPLGKPFPCSGKKFTYDAELFISELPDCCRKYSADAPGFKVVIVILKPFACLFLAENVIERYINIRIQNLLPRPQSFFILGTLLQEGLLTLIFINHLTILTFNN